MKIAVTICRLLLGLMFFVFGLNGFLHFIPVPAIPPSDMLTFVTVMHVSHFDVLVFGVQVIAGALLLANQYITLALTALAAVLANILTFHITMQPAGLPPALVAVVLWFVVCWSIRGQFAPLFARTVR